MKRRSPITEARVWTGILLLTAVLSAGGWHLSVLPLSVLAAEGKSEEAAVRPQGPREGIESLIQEQVAAWNRGDLETFCAGYAEGALFVSPSGLTEGRDEVLARYRRRYPDRAAMGTLAIEVLHLDLAEGAEGPVGASVVGRWSLAYPQTEGAREPASGLTLLYLRPRGCELCGPGFPDPEGGWEILHDASM